jgi:hypothetical protein
MSGYTMVKRAAIGYGWTERAELRGNETWIILTRNDDRVEIQLDTSPAGPLDRRPKNSVLRADIYQGESKIGLVTGSGKVDQLREYLRDGILP